VLERLRSARPGVPVVILSGRAELATKLRGFELGATPSWSHASGSSCGAPRPNRTQCSAPVRWRST
jgi:hypothetical protein